MIKIIVDSTCDLSLEELKAFDLEMIPLTINFEGEVFRDVVDISNAEFYSRLRHAHKLPTTSQVTPREFEKAFAPHIANGDEIIVITIASKLSATMHSAMVAASQVGSDNIHIIDSNTASVGTGLLVRQAVEMRDSGQLDAAKIAEQLRDLTKRIRLFAVVDTLKYLKMGGRLSPGSAIIGEVLGINPIIQVLDGEVESIAKVRGHKAGRKALSGYLDQFDIEIKRGISFGHTDAPKQMDKYIEHLKPNLGDAVIHIGYIGSVIGSHAGPGAIGVAFIIKE